MQSFWLSAVLLQALEVRAACVVCIYVRECLFVYDLYLRMCIFACLGACIFAHERLFVCVCVCVFKYV